MENKNIHTIIIIHKNTVIIFKQYVSKPKLLKQSLNLKASKLRGYTGQVKEIS